MFSPFVDDLLIVLALLFGPAGIWFTIGMTAIAIRAGRKSEKRVLREVSQALRHPRYIHTEAVRFVVAHTLPQKTSSPKQINEHPPYPGERPSRLPKWPGMRPRPKVPSERPRRPARPEIPSEVPWKQPPPEVDIDMSPPYQTRLGPGGPVVTRRGPGGSDDARPAPSEPFITRDPGSGFDLQ